MGEFLKVVVAAVVVDRVAILFPNLIAVAAKFITVCFLFVG